MILAWVPVNSPVMLNMIRVHFVGNVLNKGKSGFGGYAAGRIVKAEEARAAELALKRDGTEILLKQFLAPDFLPLLKRLRGVVLEESSYLGREQIEAMQPGLILVSSVLDAAGSLEARLTVTLHGEQFMIYEGEITQT